MLHGYLDLPTFTFWKFKNIWTGSMFRTFNYRIVKDEIKPSEDSEETTPVLRTIVWYGMDAFEKTPPEKYVYNETREFSPEGLEQIIAFLNEKLDEFKAAGGDPANVTV